MMATRSTQNGRARVSRILLRLATLLSRELRTYTRYRPLGDYTETGSP